MDDLYFLDEIINAITSSNISLSDINVDIILDKIDRPSEFILEVENQGEAKSEATSEAKSEATSEEKLTDPPMIRIGSDEVRIQEGPSCASHAFISAIRGAIEWRNKKIKSMPPSIREMYPVTMNQVLHSDLLGSMCHQWDNYIIYPDYPLRRSTDSFELFKRKFRTNFAINLRGFISYEELLNELDSGIKKNGTQLLLSIRIHSIEAGQNFELALLNQPNPDVIYEPNSKVEILDAPWETYLFPNFNKTKEQLKREFLNFENEHWELYSISKEAHWSHMMYISGYGKKDGKYYLEVKNTWGRGWGNDGKIKLSIDFFKDIKPEGHNSFPGDEDAPLRTQFSIVALNPMMGVYYHTALDQENVHDFKGGRKR